MVSRSKEESGFSVVELVVVVAISIILTTVAVFSLRANKRSYAADDEATQILSFMREAYHRALAQRQTMRVTIDRNNNIVKLMDEGLLPGGDEVEIIRGKSNDQVSFDRPSYKGVQAPLPPAPYSYGVAGFQNGTWSIRFRGDGSVVDVNGNSVSATLYFVPPNLDATLIRAITIFGPSGSVRYWRYDGSAFVSEVH